MIEINVTYKLNGVQVPPNDNFDEFMNSLFTFRAKASSARLKGSPTVLAQDGDEVGLIKDEKGNTDLPYMGAAMPNNTKKLPIFKKQYGYYSDAERSLDFVFMENETDIKYITEEEPTAFPITLCDVFYQPDYHIYEAYGNTNFLHYKGEANQRNSENTPMDLTTMRFATGEPEAELPTQLNKNAVNFDIRVIEEIEGDEDFNKVTFYSNGSFIGEAITWKKEISCLGFGTDSNCEMFGFIETSMFSGILTTEQIAELMSRLVAQYNVNKPVVLPYATDTDITIVGDTVTLDYLYNSPNDTDEDESELVIEWSADTTNGGIQAMEQLPEFANMKTFNKSSLGTVYRLRANVYVKDINGLGCLMPGVIFRDLT